MNGGRRRITQSGALPYRIDPDGGVAFLVITTGRSRRWSIPKGNISGQLSPAESAAKEAYEEAGVRGEIGQEPIGIFRTTKRLCLGKAVAEVWIYPLEVTELLPDWPEKGRREIRWVSPGEAVELLREPALAEACQRITQSLREGSGTVTRSGRSPDLRQLGSPIGQPEG